VLRYGDRNRQALQVFEQVLIRPPGDARAYWQEAARHAHAAPVRARILSALEASR